MGYIAGREPATCMVSILSGFYLPRHTFQTVVKYLLKQDGDKLAPGTYEVKCSQNENLIPRLRRPTYLKE